MKNDISELIKYYNSEEFSLAVSHTAEQTEFSSDLIEKDYLCSIVLMFLYLDQTYPLVFKGGTLLAKTYADFYRLSEDLDFTIPIPRTATRKQRSTETKPLKKLFDSIEAALSIFKIGSDLKGSNESRQYNMELNYHSQVSPKPGKIFLEVSLRENLLQPITTRSANTLLINPYTETKKVKPIMISALSLHEAYAEKTRAALCRKKLAIRDFYDLDYALTKNLIDFNDEAFISLVKKKVENESHFHDFKNPEVITFLQAKIKNELAPTLKKVTM
jgi:predicted nucleotidyltransferase component of viral defense system